MERLEEIQARCKALADKLLYFVAGGYTTQDTLRSLCKDAAFGIGDLQREIACRDAEIEKLTALAQNGQGAIDTNKRLVVEAERLSAERDAAVTDMKTMADNMRDTAEAQEDCCFACEYDCSNHDCLGFCECPGYEIDHCFKWRGLETKA